jgi:hypothetical protein
MNTAGESCSICAGSGTAFGKPCDHQAPADSAASGSRGAGAADRIDYQYRMRRIEEGSAWTDWMRCTAEGYAEHARTPVHEGWQYEVRKMYTEPKQPVEAPATGLQSTD